MEKISRFFRSRYGIDELSKCLLGVSLALMIISYIIKLDILYLIATVGLIYAYYRMLSNNFVKMSEQNRRFLYKTHNIRVKAYKLRDRLQMRKNYHIYRCSECKQLIRIPKGKGKIQVTCPKCKNTFVKNS